MKAPKRKIMRLLKAVCVIVLISVVIILFRSAFLRKKTVNLLKIFQTTYQVGDFEFDETTSTYTLSNNGETYLTSVLPSDIQRKPNHIKCEPNTHNHPSVCLGWNDVATLEVSETLNEEFIQCYNIVWTAKSSDFKPMDCLVLSDFHVYGGSALKSQQWPLEELQIDMQPYVSSHLTLDPGRSSDFGSVIERYWLTSTGLGIYVDNSVPLHVSLNSANDNFLCLKSDYDEKGVYPNPDNKLPILKYTVCKAPDVKQVHEYLSKTIFDLPIASPSESLMKFPKWSTFARFRKNVTQRNVLQLVNQINKYKFGVSQIDLEHGYERETGNFNFNMNKFRNAHQMIGELRESKFKVTTLVHPLIANNSVLYSGAAKKHIFILDRSRSDFQPYNFTFENEKVSLLDLTNVDAVTWFKTNLESIKMDHLINSFKFYLGEANFLSPKSKSQNILSNPCAYTTKYVEVAQNFGNDVIVNAAFQTQKYPVYVEIGDRSSSWDKENGLPSIIPTVITYGLLGYPFVIPGPIGGVSQTVNKTTGLPTLPDRDLYIRWLQMTAYLPVMQFSVAPWEYDEEVVSIATKYIKIHEAKVLPILLLAAKASQINGSPLIRPVWWVAPEDSTALRIDCEFLVGDSILVAPIVDQGARQRHVYLPKGSHWEDQLHGKQYEGGQWLMDYDVGIKDIATFKNLKNAV